MCARACVRVGVRVRVCSPLPWRVQLRTREDSCQGPVVGFSFLRCCATARLCVCVRARVRARGCARAPLYTCDTSMVTVPNCVRRS